MQKKMTVDAQVILLLCAVLEHQNEPKPLTISEYSKFARWLYEHQKRPGDLLTLEQDNFSLDGCGLDTERIKKLLKRKVLLGLAFEAWEQAGIWIVTRSDTDYPARYKHHLKDQAPPFLYGIGDRALLLGGGLCIVGSRNVDKEGDVFTEKVAERCAKDGVTVISGGARGVDEISMVTALRSGGKVIGVLADSLLKKSTGRFYREAIAHNNLLLLSPYHPKAGFSAGNAMGRNKLVYALSDFALVVQSDYNKGGTWAGATEELKRDQKKERFPEGSIPVFVRNEEKVPKGNRELMGLGALPFPVLTEENLSDRLLACAKDKPKSAVQGDLFGSAVHESSAEEKQLSDVPLVSSLEKLPAAKEEKTKENHISNPDQQPHPQLKTVEASDTRGPISEPGMGLVEAARKLLNSTSKKKKVPLALMAKDLPLWGWKGNLGTLTESFLSAALLVNNQQLKSRKLPVEFQLTEEGIVSLAPKRKPKGITLMALSEAIDQEALGELCPNAFQTLFIALLTQMGFVPYHCFQASNNGEFDVSGYMVHDFISQNVRIVISRATDKNELSEKAFQLQKNLCAGQLGIFMDPSFLEEQLSAVKLPSYSEGIIIFGQNRLSTLFRKYGLMK